MSAIIAFAISIITLITCIITIERGMDLRATEPWDETRS